MTLVHEGDVVIMPDVPHRLDRCGGPPRCPDCASMTVRQFARGLRIMAESARQALARLGPSIRAAIGAAQQLPIQEKRPRCYGPPPLRVNGHDYQRRRRNRRRRR